jgi:hypothetical protein
MPTQPDHAAALQTILNSLGVLTVSQLVDLFNKYSDTAGFAGVLHSAVPEIVGQHAQAAATVTAQWYDELAPDKPFQATPVVNLVPERVRKSVDWSLYAPGDSTPLQRMAGSAKRMVYDASRDTAVQNASEEGVRWARYASANACAFCRVLATRGDFGPGYVSKESATTVVGRRGSARGSRKLGEKYHDHCRCIAVPIRDGTYTPPPYVAEWEDQYNAARDAGHGDMKSILSYMRAHTDAA